MVLRPSDLGWNYTTSFPGSLQRQIMGLLSLYNYMSQFFITYVCIGMISIYL